MPDMFMDVDVYINSIPFNFLPLIDDTDFKSIETGIVWNQAGMDVVWNFVTTAGVQTQTPVILTASGNYTLIHRGKGMYVTNIPSSGDTINNDTEGFGWFTGVCDGVYPWRSPVVCFRATGLNNKLIDDVYSDTRGLTGTSVPDAVAGTAGGLPLSASGLDLDDILADTNELQSDLTNGGRLDTILDELTVQGDANETKLNTVIADTNELQGDLTNGGRVDLILDELTTQGDANETKLDTVVADTNELQTDITNGGRLDLILDELTVQSDTNETKLDTINTNIGNLVVKRNVAIANYMFPMDDIGLTVTAERIIDSGDFESCANSVSEKSDKVYSINLADSDLNGESIMLKFSAPGVETRFITILTIP